MKKYKLHLYISGMSERSMKAIANINAVCKEHLAGHYDLEIIDIYKRGAMAEQQQIIACPSLVKDEPLPRRVLIGDLSDRPKVLSALGITS